MIQSSTARRYSVPPLLSLLMALSGLAEAGSISGKVTFQGTAPPPEKIKVAADPKCQAQHPTGLERRVVHGTGGGLADVFVYLKTGLKVAPPASTEPVLLNQKGCEYLPHILGVQAGQPIRIRNSDDTLHNIHPRPALNTAFNVGQPRAGVETTRTFDKPEKSIPVGCDVHPWMRGFIFVIPHPFFTVSQEDGAFTISNVPPGDYEVEAVHEKLGSLTARLSVKDGAPAVLDFAFKAAP